MYAAAVFTGNHITTGNHHGEAFSKLEAHEKETADLVVSGHINPDGSFTTEMTHEDKNLIIIRHCESLHNIGANADLNSFITVNGWLQGRQMVQELRDMDLTGFVGFTSPYDRCLITSHMIHKAFDIDFDIDIDLGEITDHYPDGVFAVKHAGEHYPMFRWGDAPDCIEYPKEPTEVFIERMTRVFKRLPERAIIVTHGSCVLTLIEMALGAKIESIPHWDGSLLNASISHIEYGTLRRGVHRNART